MLKLIPCILFIKNQPAILRAAVWSRKSRAPRRALGDTRQKW